MVVVVVLDANITGRDDAVVPAAAATARRQAVLPQERIHEITAAVVAATTEQRLTWSPGPGETHTAVAGGFTIRCTPGQVSIETSDIEPQTIILDGFAASRVLDAITTVSRDGDQLASAFLTSLGQLVTADG